MARTWSITLCLARAWCRTITWARTWSRSNHWARTHPVTSHQAGSYSTANHLRWNLLQTQPPSWNPLQNSLPQSETSSLIQTPLVEDPPVPTLQFTPPLKNTATNKSQGPITNNPQTCQAWNPATIKSMLSLQPPEGRAPWQQLEHHTALFKDRDPTLAKPCLEKRQITPIHCMLIVSVRKVTSTISICSSRKGASTRSIWTNVAKNQYQDLRHDSTYHTTQTGTETVLLLSLPKPHIQQVTGRASYPLHTPHLFKNVTQTKNTMLKCCSPMGISFPCCMLASQFLKITRCTMKHNRAKILLGSQRNTNTLHPLAPLGTPVLRGVEHLLSLEIPHTCSSCLHTSHKRSPDRTLVAQVCCLASALDKGLSPTGDFYRTSYSVFSSFSTSWLLPSSHKTWLCS